MKAFVLAAGVGSRLSPLTDRMPKPMVPLGGVPILERNIRLLASHGWKDIIINLHHRPEVITDAFGNGERLGVRIRYSPEPQLMGTGGALDPWRRELTDTFLLLFGDNCFIADLQPLKDAHNEHAAAATIGTTWREDVASSGLVQCDETGNVTSFIEKPVDIDGPGMVSAGILVLEPSVLDLVPTNAPSDLGSEVLPSLLEQKALVIARPIQGSVYWIDSMADLEEAQRRFTKVD